MTRQVHETILQKISQWQAPISLITHAGLGEPLLDNMLEERIVREKQFFPDATVIVYTNGSLLDKDRALRLLESGVDAVSFSINGFHRETYESVMKLSRDTTYSNVERFIQLKNSLGLQTGVNVSLVKTDQCSNEEVEEYSQFWQSRGIKATVPPWINWGGLFENSCHGEQLPCMYIWKIMMFDQDGTVKMCCEDYDSKHPLGNIMSHDPNEIFNSPFMQQHRSNQINGDFSQPDICVNCVETHQTAKDFWMRSPSLVTATPPANATFNQEVENTGQSQSGLDTFLSWLDSLNQEQYKLALGHMLAKGLDTNKFDYPEGIWPPPTPARSYIEQFLNAYQGHVRGKCVEFNPAVYREMFINKPDVSSYDVWNLSPGRNVTVVADLQNAANIPSEYFDTIICTHVLSAVKDVWKAAAELRRVLKTGGLVLFTVPSILQQYAPDPKDYWRMTQDSVRDLFGDFSRCEVHSLGNSATVSGSPYYLMNYHYPDKFMENHSEKCPSIIAAAAWK